MNYKTGKHLYNVYVDDDGKVFLSEHIVRTIRGGYVHAVQKENGMTWVKQSKKNGDFGWANSIPDYCRDKVEIGGKFKYLHTTKLAAYRAALKGGLKHTEDPLRAKKALEKKINTLKTRIEK